MHSRYWDARNINYRGFNIALSQQLLYSSNVSPTFQQMDSKTLPEGIYRGFLLTASLLLMWIKIHLSGK
jgi:hypothetical protein